MPSIIDTWAIVLKTNSYLGALISQFRLLGVQFVAKVAALVSGFCLALLSSCSSSSLSKFKHHVFGSDGRGGGGDLHLEVRKYVLPNGLRLIVHPNDRLPIIGYYTFFAVGGRHESKELGTTGATHFLEHMMFKGTKNYAPGRFDRLIENNGGRNNAYTSFDSTVYYEIMPSDKLDILIDVESDRMKNLLMEKTSFENERQVIMEERRMRYENSPRGQLYLAMMQAVFEGTPYGGSVIGSRKDLESLERDQVESFYHRFYTPDNAIIVIAGDVEPDKVHRKILKAYGKLNRSTKEVQEYRELMDKPERYTHRGRYRREIRLRGKNPIPMFALAYRGTAVGERRGFVMDILSSILGDGESSYLYQRYVKKTPMVSSIGVGNYTLQKNGVFYVMGQLLAKTNLKTFKRSLIKETGRICDKAVTQRSLDKTKNQYLINYYRSIQDNSGIAHFLGVRESAFGDYSFYKKELEIYRSITLDEVRKACDLVFKGKEYIFLSNWSKHPKRKSSRRD